MNVEEIKILATELTEKLAALSIGERTVILEAMRERFCTRCGGEGPERKCWCDYDSPLDS